MFVLLYIISGNITYQFLMPQSQGKHSPPLVDQSQIAVTMLAQCMLDIQSEGVGGFGGKPSLWLHAPNWNQIQESFDHVPKEGQIRMKGTMYHSCLLMTDVCDITLQSWCLKHLGTMHFV